MNKNILYNILWFCLLLITFWLSTFLNSNNKDIENKKTIPTVMLSSSVEIGQKWIKYDTSNPYDGPVTDTMIILDKKRDFCKILWINTYFTDTISLHIGIITCCGRYLEKR
jgi:hypothetical protein